MVDPNNSNSPQSPFACVIIPAYNAARTLPATLAALRAQTIPTARLEVIVVDDGSTDATAAVAAAAGVRVLRGPNRGAAAARNWGAAVARADIVLFTDADCVPAPGWVAAMLAPFRDPAVVGVKGAYRTQQRSLVARFAQIEFLDRYALQARQPTIDLVDSYAAGFRRAAFLAADGYHTGFIGNEDVELSYRLADRGARLVFAPDAVVYHTHAATLGRYLRVKVSRGYWRILVYRRYPHKVLRDSYTPQVLKAQVALLGALAGCTGPALLWPPLRPLCGVLAGSLIASTLPFTAFAARYDPVVAVCAPALVIGRALALGLGSAAALVGLGPGLRRG